MVKEDKLKDVEERLQEESLALVEDKSKTILGDEDVPYHILVESGIITLFFRKSREKFAYIGIFV